VPERSERSVRIAKPKYGAISAPERPVRPARSARSQWGRYDSPGRTLYVASDLETAFAEVLSPFKRQLGATDPLEADAAALGITRAELLEIISAEWTERGFMGMGAIPRQWRTDRSIFQLFGQGDGWYIDVEHPDSIAAIEVALEGMLAKREVSSLTTAILRGPDRDVTTRIGRFLRRVDIDSGAPAKGIQFGSKFGGGWCRAIWLPDDDSVLDLVALSGEPILVSNEALARASERFRIRVF
jgi:hypothetical protein